MPKILPYLFKALRAISMVCIWVIATAVASKLSPCYGVAAFLALPVMFLSAEIHIKRRDRDGSHD